MPRRPRGDPKLLLRQAQAEADRPDRCAKSPVVHHRNDGSWRLSEDCEATVAGRGTSEERQPTTPSRTPPRPSSPEPSRWIACDDPSPTEMRTEFGVNPTIPLGSSFGITLRILT